MRNILALRGDPPGNVRGQWTPHPEGLDHADQLVALIRTLGDFTIGVAAFPDVHPDSPDLDHDVEVLVRKADAGASFAITQMVFDADTYLRLRDRVAARRELPITPGLMPVTNLKQIHPDVRADGHPAAARRRRAARGGQGRPGGGAVRSACRSRPSWVSGCSTRAPPASTSSR